MRLAPIYGGGDPVCWAEDITHDAFLCLYVAKALPELHKRRSVLPWLLRTLTNKARDYYRKKANHEILLGDLPDTISSPSCGDDFIALDSILSHLSRNEQIIFYMNSILGYTAEDIAQELGIKPAACRQRIHRIREKLKKLHYDEFL